MPAAAQRGVGEVEKRDEHEQPAVQQDVPAVFRRGEVDYRADEIARAHLHAEVKARVQQVQHGADEIHLQQAQYAEVVARAQPFAALKIARQHQKQRQRRCEQRAHKL